jgi:thermostable 8-oxoguanine DNA glycosylase
MKKRNSGEYQIQMRFFNWVRRNLKDSSNEKLKEALSLCYASQNGADMSIQERQRMLMAGLVPGMPDVTLDYPVVKTGIEPPLWCCPGLKMEFKYGNNVLTHEQEKMKALFLEIGWRYEEPRSVQEAIDIVVSYLPFPVKDYVPPKYL